MQQGATPSGDRLQHHKSSTSSGQEAKDLYMNLGMYQNVGGAAAAAASATPSGLNKVSFVYPAPAPVLHYTHLVLLGCFLYILFAMLCLSNLCDFVQLYSSLAVLT